ncbi:MAG TPA: GntR family transcriptional regulator [Alphaproteobacteria bacterium]|nr:GntR family transcriptional regulator [Alphaproteobacteria bacterium]
MEEIVTTADGALIQLRAWLAQRKLPSNGRLPPEREFAEILGVSRGDLRKALATLENNGELWRQVGKGTFIGTKPVDELSVVGKVADQSNPLEVMNARILIEPIICQQAAMNAASIHIDELNRCMVAQRAAQNWRQYENADNRLHRIIAIASGNIVLLALFDQLNAIRRAVVWGRLRQHSDVPPTNHHSFSQHEKIITAISQRDPELSASLMREHLEEVRDNLMSPNKMASSVQI